ncbi:MAG TPA: hypothetical protein VLI54_04715 [Bacillota bacterium]|nr:hypothetical protein [Bacillota bacterium]
MSGRYEQVYVHRESDPDGAEAYWGAPITNITVRRLARVGSALVYHSLSDTSSEITFASSDEIQPNTAGASLMTLHAYECIGRPGMRHLLMGGVGTLAAAHGLHAFIGRRKIERADNAQGGVVLSAEHGTLSDLAEKEGARLLRGARARLTAVRAAWDSEAEPGVSVASLRFGADFADGATLWTEVAAESHSASDGRAYTLTVSGGVMSDGLPRPVYKNLVDMPASFGAILRLASHGPSSSA